MTRDQEPAPGEMGGALNQNQQSDANQNSKTLGGKSQKGPPAHQGPVGGGKENAEMRRRGAGVDTADDRVKGWRD
ncbi:hypothetical protein GCM10007036_36210 [Alsobacter metallidurans]|uniref:Uncharacterized protein n=1 Tax=Alsobacter metallidurans TaxID=340221 RepID=A0A917MJ70_9HYPH|nr:hypothetical protein [Alsobacter metallidurans]GGH27585.1 hypothetical protein GCM10007036_36210 [Alsobacter metallidurans]